MRAPGFEMGRGRNPVQFPGQEAAEGIEEKSMVSALTESR